MQDKKVANSFLGGPLTGWKLEIILAAWEATVWFADLWLFIREELHFILLLVFIFFNASIFKRFVLKEDYFSVTYNTQHSF